MATSKKDEVLTKKVAKSGEVEAVGLGKEEQRQRDKHRSLRPERQLRPKRKQPAESEQQEPRMEQFYSYGDCAYSQIIFSKYR
mmetsp:Transcript_23644/g.41897  ORF Transcript_23644/g.41897 Transcript_23644/m.41897 type:complete len:83 (+) Transcript_23644:88-336(+)